MLWTTSLTAIPYSDTGPSPPCHRAKQDQMTMDLSKLSNHDSKSLVFLLISGLSQVLCQQERWLIQSVCCRSCATRTRRSMISRETQVVGCIHLRAIESLGWAQLKWEEEHHHGTHLLGLHAVLCWTAIWLQPHFSLPTVSFPLTGAWWYWPQFWLLLLHL